MAERIPADQRRAWARSMAATCPVADRIALAGELMAAGQPETAVEERGWLLYYAD